MNLVSQPSAQPSTPVLGYGPMDAVHADFDRMVAQARACSDVEFPHCLQAVIGHLREHFEQEDRWMRETDFPPGDCHQDEHAAVLTSADEVLALPDPAQRLSVGRAFVAELANWFPGHADYLDSALAAWMCKRPFGGKPVVVHRA